MTQKSQKKLEEKAKIIQNFGVIKEVDNLKAEVDQDHKPQVGKAVPISLDVTLYNN